MFARIKRSGGRAYLVVVENERVYTSPTEPAGHRQREIARLGRVDTMHPDEQERIREAISSALKYVAPIRPKRGRGLVRG
jgi:hypothetical protein